MKAADEAKQGEALLMSEESTYGRAKEKLYKEGKTMMEKSKRGKQLVSRSLVLALLLSLLFMTHFLQVSEAAEYPTKSIQMMVGYPPGGGSDLLARILVDKLSSLLRQQVVVVNKPGGGGVICAYHTLTAPADGYTIMVIPPAMFLAPYLVKGVTYDIIRDFKQISLATNSPLLLCVGKDSPWQTFEQLVADAKKNPGKLTYAAAGYGNTWLQGELIRDCSGKTCNLLEAKSNHVIF